MSSNFNTTRIGTDQSLGQVLRAKREEKKLSLEDISRRTKIQIRVIEALEDDRFDDLPDAYTRGLLKTYASTLGLPPEALRPYWQAVRIREQQSNQKARSKPRLRRTFWVRPRKVAAAGGAGLLTLLLVLFFHEVQVLAKTPEIHFDAPYTDTSSGETVLRGSVDPDAALTVQGLNVPVREDGHFAAHLFAPDGISRVDFVVRSHYGRSTAISRTVTSYPSQVVSSTAPVAFRVQAEKRPIWLTMLSGSGTVFEGIMLPGAVHTFYGSDLTLSTSDAGATFASVSNLKVQGKDLGQLGRDHEPLNGLRVGSDTGIK